MSKYIFLASLLSTQFVFLSTSLVLLTSLPAKAQIPKVFENEPVCYLRTPKNQIVNLSHLCGTKPDKAQGVTTVNQSNSAPSSANANNQFCQTKDECLATFGFDSPPPIQPGDLPEGQFPL